MRWPTYPQKQTTFKRLGYNPFPLQDKIHQITATVTQIVGAEGSGKSLVTASEVVACVPWSTLVYLVGETFENTQAEFYFIAGHLLRLGAVEPERISQPKRGRWELTTKTSCKILTLSARKGASSVIALGQQPDIIVLCEAGTISSFGVATAAVRRATRAKGRVILTGTLRDDYGWYAALVDEFQAVGNAWDGETFSLPAWTNLKLYPDGENDAQIKRLRLILPEDEFSRTIAAQRMPSKALVFPEFSFMHHVRPCPFDPALPVHIWIDPGYYPSAYVVLAVQFHGAEVWVIDEIYLHHHTHTEIINLTKRCTWWGKVERGVIDVAGRQHHAEQSAIEVWQAEAGIYLHSEAVGVLDGIARHRTFLGKPMSEEPTETRLFHDTERTKETQREYKLYRRPADKDGNATSDLPRDEHNHAMKAMAYGLMERFGPVDRLREVNSGVARNERIREGLEEGWG